MHECEICNLQFRTIRGLRTHKTKIHGVITSICDGCDVELKEKINWSGGSRFICKPCELERERRYRKIKFGAEYEYKIINGQYICDTCNRPFKTLYGVNNHKTLIHIKPRKRFCKKCSIELVLDNNITNKILNKTGWSWCSECFPAEQKTYLRNYYEKRKNLVIDGYGGQCECCGETKFEFLTIDHKYNDGNAERKQKHLFGRALYDWLIKNNYPKDRYQLLCWNCNCSKAYHDCCPHKKQTEAGKTTTYAIELETC